MNYYEIPFAVLSEIPLQGIETLRSKILDLLEKHSGGVVKSEYWGVREFAYKIRKHSKGRFYLITIKAAGTLPVAIGKYFGINESILRYAVYKVDSIREKPSFILSKLLEAPEYASTEEEKAFSNLFNIKQPA